MSQRRTISTASTAGILVALMALLSTLLVPTAAAAPAAQRAAKAAATVLAPVGWGEANWAVGTDIAPGRYKVTAVVDGDIFYGSDAVEILSPSGERIYRVNFLDAATFTVNLKKGEQVRVTNSYSSFHGAKFTPVTVKKRSKLTAGMWTVGQDVKAGSFRVTTKKSFSVLELSAKSGRLLMRSVVGPSGGDPAITVTLFKGNQITVLGGTATLKKVTPKLSSELGIGMWIVGQDIKAGTYRATPVGGGNRISSDNVVVQTKAGKVRGSYTLGKNSGSAAKKATITLKKGDRVFVRGGMITGVSFAAK